MEQLRRQGWNALSLAVDGDGRVDQRYIVMPWRKRPKLVSVMLANNETGVIQDVFSLAEQARAAGAVFHTDAVRRAVGKLPVDFRALNAAGVLRMTVSAHKIGGPKVPVPWSSTSASNWNL